MKVLFAAAELAPLVRVGGLAEAAGGLVAALRRESVDVDLVLPDYGGVELADESHRPLTVPEWAGAMWARSGIHPAIGPVTLLASDQMFRPHPYVDDSGTVWPDNDLRFMQFAAAIAAVRDETGPDVLHLNDWHTAAATALGSSPVPTALTIHTLAYQGVASPDWLRHLERGAGEFMWYDQTNPLAGGIALADRVIAVSPHYAEEILAEESGSGLHEILRAKGDGLVGILNGIDGDEWNPAADGHLAVKYDLASLERRVECRRDLMAHAGWDDDSKDPVIGVVSRLVDQKGIDLLLEMVPYLATLPARLFVLGSGLAELAADLHDAAAAQPDLIFFQEGYDLGLAHRVFAGADLLAMPSRFEPCGLAQMQAMRYGAIPVVTPVGGLVDTVTDIDADLSGNGIVAHSVDAAGIVDALHRAVRAYRNVRRRGAMQRRGMEHDWSWHASAARHISLYRELADLR